MFTVQIWGNKKAKNLLTAVSDKDSYGLFVEEIGSGKRIMSTIRRTSVMTRILAKRKKSTLWNKSKKGGNQH